MHYIGCDPGLDELVFSVYHAGTFQRELAARRGQMDRMDRFESAAAAFVRQERVKTSAKVKDSIRLEQLVEATTRVLRTFAPCRLFVEHPKTWVSYGNRGTSVTTLAYSIAAVEAAAQAIGTPWEPIHPDTVPKGFPAKGAKEYRKKMIGWLFGGAASQFTTQDQIDAAWVGIRALVRSDLRAAQLAAANLRA